jgi:hypothetical protein
MKRSKIEENHIMRSSIVARLCSSSLLRPEVSCLMAEDGGSMFLKMLVYS